MRLTVRPFARPSTGFSTFFFFSSRRRHTRCSRDWSSDVCSSDLFKAFERFSHWLTAISFVVLGLTGLNITFGKIVLLPLLGPDTFSDVAQAAKYEIGRASCRERV